MSKYKGLDDLFRGNELQIPSLNAYLQAQLGQRNRPPAAKRQPYRSGNGETPLLIAVLGVTGSGKSTFINRATGRNDLATSSGLHSCTADIALAPLSLDGRSIVLIDTPGFDDTDRTDSEILVEIAKWLKTTYDANTLLTGVIMLQPISTNKFGMTESNRTRLFEKICGPQAFEHVILTTTMWDKVKPEDEEQCMRWVQERKRDPKFWGDMCNQGAEVAYHDNTRSSCHRIIRKLLNKSTVTLQIQDELEANGGVISATSAGQQMQSYLSAKMMKLEEQLEAMMRDRETLLQELQRMRQTIEGLQNQQQTLNETTKEDSWGKRAWLTALAAATSAVSSVYTAFCEPM